jgi:hypothetical protein
LKVRLTKGFFFERGPAEVMVCFVKQFEMCMYYVREWRNW